MVATHEIIILIRRQRRENDIVGDVFMMLGRIPGIGTSQMKSCPGDQLYIRLPATGQSTAECKSGGFAGRTFVVFMAAVAWSTVTGERWPADIHRIGQLLGASKSQANQVPVFGLIHWTRIEVEDVTGRGVANPLKVILRTDRFIDVQSDTD